jgi:outer membrane cobalamin receptor
MKHLHVQTIGIAACVLAACNAMAQQKAALQTEAVVVTGSPIIESNNVSSFSTLSTAVTDTQVRDLGALDLAAALRMTPGVQISRYNEVGSYDGNQGGSVFIRGLGVSRPGSEIKTYVDGLPVYMGLWNHPLIDLLPLNGVKTISIQKGPDLPSSGNNFAAVNLESKRATKEGLQGEANVSIGSHATKTAHGSIVGKRGAVDFMLAAGHADSDGARPNSDAKLDNAIGRIGFAINDHWSLGAGFLSVNNKVGDPGDNRYATSSVGIGPYTFSNGVARNQSSTNLLSVYAKHQHGTWTGEFTFYENRGENNLTNDAAWGTFKSKFVMSGFKWQEAFSPWQGGQVVAGIDRESIRGDVTGPHVGSAVGTPFAFNTAGSASIPEFNLLSTHVAIAHRFKLNDQWALQPSIGIRAYDSNRYASKTASQAGLSLISDQVTAYANYVEGIIYPGAETNAITRALPMAFTANNGWDRLEPTQNKHKEVGIKWDISTNTHVDFSLFKDAISKRYVWSGFNATATGVWSNNFPDYNTHGAEVSVQHQVSQDWRIFAGATRLESSLFNLPYAPRSAVSAGVNGRVAGYTLSVDAQYQSAMYSLPQDRGAFTPNPVSSFTVANARVAHPLAMLGKGGEVYVMVNNLFNTAYQYNAGYPMPDRNVRVGLTAGF